MAHYKLMALNLFVEKVHSYRFTGLSLANTRAIFFPGFRDDILQRSSYATTQENLI